MNSGKALKEAKSGSLRIVPNLRLYSLNAVRRQSAAFFPSPLPPNKNEKNKIHQLCKAILKDEFKIWFETAKRKIQRVLHPEKRTYQKKNRERYKENLITIYRMWMSGKLIGFDVLA